MSRSLRQVTTSFIFADLEESKVMEASRRLVDHASEIARELECALVGGETRIETIVVPTDWPRA